MFGNGARLYRLWLRNGSPFTIRMAGNPPVAHDGGTTVVHLALTDKQANVIQTMVRKFGADCGLIPHERQTPEQTKERQTLLGLQRGDRVWPSVSCLTCTWFDPLLDEEPCGRAGWEAETIEAFSENALSQKALSECPVPYVWDKVG